MKSQFDYQEVAMYFDKLVRSHDVHRWVGQGRPYSIQRIKMDNISEC